MELGLISGYSARKMSIPIDATKHPETLDYRSIWTAEAHGSDAVMPSKRIKQRLQRWKDAAAAGHIDTLIATGASIEALRLIAQETL